MITSAKQFQIVLQIVKLHEKELKAKREVWASKVIQRTFTKWWSYKSLMLHQMNTDFDEESNTMDLLWYQQWEPRTHWDAYWEQEEGLAEVHYRQESRY
jgi:hypothetical protein